jgi:hypothetical protein
MADRPVSSPIFISIFELLQVKRFIAFCFRRPKRHRSSSSIVVAHTVKHARVLSPVQMRRVARPPQRRTTPKPSPTLTSRLSSPSLRMPRSGLPRTKSLHLGAACVEKLGSLGIPSSWTVTPRRSSRFGESTATSAGCRHGWEPTRRGGRVQSNIRAARTLSGPLGRCVNGRTITVKAGRSLKSLYMRRYEQICLDSPGDTVLS